MAISAKKGKKPGDAMSPLEKARAAQAARKASGKKAPARKKVAIPVFKAPEDFKPFFSRVRVLIGKDGLATDIKVLRIQGSPTNENAKTVDMALHDPDTLRRIAIRYAGAAFVVSPAKRLPANAVISFLMRVSKRSADSSLTTSFKDFKIKLKDAPKLKALEKTDPIYRRARKPVRQMPAAFVNVKPFPTAAELKALNATNEEPEVEMKSKKASKAAPAKKAAKRRA